jgi:hypothetical protein
MEFTTLLKGRPDRIMAGQNYKRPTGAAGIGSCSAALHAVPFGTAGRSEITRSMKAFEHSIGCMLSLVLIRKSKAQKQ